MKPIVLVLTLCSLNGHSQETPDRGPIPFNVYDIDNNGFISETEFKSIRDKRIENRTKEGRPMHGMANAPVFSEFDTNKDSQLSQDELKAGQEAQMKKRRKFGMGRSQASGGAGMRMNMPTFTEFDLNSDGFILENELSEARQKRRASMKTQGRKMQNLNINPPSFKDLDLNNDGKINKDEFIEHQLKKRSTSMGKNQTSNVLATQDVRTFVEMPDEDRNLMRQGMLKNLATLNSIISSLANKDFDAAANAAETVMGRSAMGKHRASGVAPGMFMTTEMRALGWEMHDSASEFSEIAKKGNYQDSLEALAKMTNSCVACHSNFRTR